MVERESLSWNPPKESHVARGIELETVLGCLLSVGALDYQREVILIQQPANGWIEIELNSVFIPFLDLKVLMKNVLVVDIDLGVGSRVPERAAGNGVEVVFRIRCKSGGTQFPPSPHYFFFPVFSLPLSRTPRVWS